MLVYKCKNRIADKYIFHVVIHFHRISFFVFFFKFSITFTLLFQSAASVIWACNCCDRKENVSAFNSTHIFCSFFFSLWLLAYQIRYDCRKLEKWIHNLLTDYCILEAIETEIEIIDRFICRTRFRYKCHVFCCCTVYTLWTLWILVKVHVMHCIALHCTAQYVAMVLFFILNSPFSWEKLQRLKNKATKLVSILAFQYFRKEYGKTTNTFLIYNVL